MVYPQNKLLFNRIKVLIYAVAWMKLENILVNEGGLLPRLHII